MKITVISKGKKGRYETAQIVIVRNGRSATRHLIQDKDGIFCDKNGNSYAI